MYSNFLDLESKEGACINVWPVPYQGTVSFGAGTREGPEAMLRASYQIETFDGQTGVDLADIAHFVTHPFLRTPVSGPSDVHRAMRSWLADFDPSCDFFLTLGGEHSITLPLLEFYRQAYPDLCVLQIDAHADLRDKYESSPYSHASVMARAIDIGVDLAQVGIRSLCAEEMETIKNLQDSRICTVFAWELEDPAATAAKINRFIAGRPLYISFDADGMDPGVIPGTGTPEPGGISYQWLVQFLSFLWPGSRLVGMDFCELAPLAGSVVSESAAVKCILKILIQYFKKKE